MESGGGGRVRRGDQQKVRRFYGGEATSPSAIVPGFLYLGDAFDATSATKMRSLGIRRVVNCAADRDRRIVTDDEGKCDRPHILS